MLSRLTPKAPDHVYPADPWRLVESCYHPQRMAQAESFFALSNGYLGLRGTGEEHSPVHERGTFVNGFHETWPIVYGEDAYGFAKTGQTMVEVPDGKILQLYVDDEPFFLPTARLLRCERWLDMRAGVLEREICWETAAGKLVAIRSRRLVSLEHRHLAAIDYEVTVLNGAAPVVVSSELVLRHKQRESRNEDASDPRQRGHDLHKVLLPRGAEIGEDGLILSFATPTSDMRLGCGMAHDVSSECGYSLEVSGTESSGKVVISADARPGQPIRIVKYLAYHTSRGADARDLRARVGRTIVRAQADGIESLEAEQRSVLDGFWQRSDVAVHGAVAVQQAVRFNLFHVFQATARAEGVGVPAKGLTGSGYEGHYFWDTEIYVLPYLIYTSPRIARNLLRFRLGFLDQARARARQVNERGALFPWRTINGEEASAFYAAGTAQYHINADIAYALRKYVEITGDESLLFERGAEALIETARLWRSLGFFSTRKDGQFCIHGVTGPDEYTTVVNNNTFTNLMARANLRYAVEVLHRLRTSHPAHYEILVRETELDPEEIVEWQQAADRMYVPYDSRLGIHPQDDAFLDREPWDFDKTPADHYPLLLRHHPLVIYRHQVIKQADTVLAMFLLGEEFSLDEKRRNFDYYDRLTTGDSSLSSCIQSIVAAEIGDFDKAYAYAANAVMADLFDIHGNAKDGLHIASMAGVWMIAAYGLAGMRDYGGRLSFRPRVFGPRGERVRFPLGVRGRRLEVDVGRDAIRYRLLAGADLSFEHFDETIELTAEEPCAERVLGVERTTA